MVLLAEKCYVVGNSKRNTYSLFSKALAGLEPPCVALGFGRAKLESQNWAKQKAPRQQQQQQQ